MGRQPDGLVNSLASVVINEQYSWDLTRFEAFPTGGPGGGGEKTVPRGPSGEAGTFWTWYMSRLTSTGAYGLGTFNGRPNDQCTNQGEWSDEDYPRSLWVSDVATLTVFGDSKCSYKADYTGLNPMKDQFLGTITCNKWKDARCYQDDTSKGQKCVVNEFDFPMAYCRWE